MVVDYSNPTTMLGCPKPTTMGDNNRAAGQDLAQFAQTTIMGSIFETTTR